MSQDTGKFRTKTIDKFYTQPSVALHCINRIRSTLDSSGSDLTWIEPSAGSGAFLHGFDSSAVIAIDLEPGDPLVTQADFLTWTPPPSPSSPSDRLLFYGNPPFGRQGSLAKAFIQRATSFSTTEAVAFILPRSFLKPSMSRAFPPRFHCIVTDELEPSSFEVNGEPYAVPCIFQIWCRRAVDRPVPEVEEPTGFAYVKQTDRHHLVVRRVGVYAGKATVQNPTEPKSVQSHYFIRLDSPYVDQAATAATALTAHEFPSNTTGPRSLSKGEVTAVLNGILAELTGS